MGKISRAVPKKRKNEEAKLEEARNSESGSGVYLDRG